MAFNGDACSGIVGAERGGLRIRGAILDMMILAGLPVAASWAAGARAAYLFDFRV